MIVIVSERGNRPVAFCAFRRSLGEKPFLKNTTKYATRLFGALQFSIIEEKKMTYEPIDSIKPASIYE